jgi:hypothetical protein
MRTARTRQTAHPADPRSKAGPGQDLDTLRSGASDLRLNYFWTVRGSMTLKLGTIVAFFGVALPAVGQYGGPAILTRGEAPSAMSQAQIDFRPFVSATVGYSTGLAGVGLSETGNLPDYSSYTAKLGWGVSGTHSWRRTQLGLSYSGSLNHYFGRGHFDFISHALKLGITHRLTPHATLTIAQTAGVFSRDAGLRGLEQTVPFDPSTSYIPTQDYFDNRTIHTGTQAHLTFQRSARTSVSLGGGYYHVAYRSSALNGSTGLSANGDLQYRLSRRVTIGSAYSYNHFAYKNVFGGADLHGAVGTFGVGLTRSLEISGYMGVGRVEATFTRTVALDPAIVALLGIATGTEVAHAVTYIPTYAARVAKNFPRGVFSASVGHSVVPGNGLFLTSSTTMLLAGYTYTGLRRWSMGVYASDASSKAITDLAGKYRTTSGGLSVSRKITGSLHFVATGSVRRYGSPCFSKYNRVVSDFYVGVGYTPGDIPLRVW